MIDQLFQRFLRKLAYAAPGGYSVRPLLHRMRGVQIGKRVWISQYVYIDELHPEAISIGDNTSLGIRSSVISHFYWGPRRSEEHAGRVRIESDVFVGPHCLILPNVHIGKGAVILAGTVVSRDVPPGVLWGMPKAGPLAHATVPLTHDSSFEKFIRGLRPIMPAQPDKPASAAA